MVKKEGKSRLGRASPTIQTAALAGNHTSLQQRMQDFVGCYLCLLVRDIELLLEQVDNDPSRGTSFPPHYVDYELQVLLPHHL
jgi:hypothetical protein